MGSKHVNGRACGSYSLIQVMHEGFVIINIIFVKFFVGFIEVVGQRTRLYRFIAHGRIENTVVIPEILGCKQAEAVLCQQVFHIGFS